MFQKLINFINNLNSEGEPEMKHTDGFPCSNECKKRTEKLNRERELQQNAEKANQIDVYILEYILSEAKRAIQKAVSDGFGNAHVSVGYKYTKQKELCRCVVDYLQYVKGFEAWFDGTALKIKWIRTNDLREALFDHLYPNIRKHLTF